MAIVCLICTTLKVKVERFMAAIQGGFEMTPMQCVGVRHRQWVFFPTNVSEVCLP